MFSRSVIKLYILCLCLVTSLFGAYGVFAQTGPVQGLQIDAINKTLYGKIVETQAGKELVIELHTATYSEQLSTTFPIKPNPLSLSLGEFFITETTVKVQNNVVYTHLSIKTKDVDGVVSTEPLQTFLLADIISKTELLQNKVQASWNSAEVKQSTSGVYYYSFKGGAERTRNETVYLNVVKKPIPPIQGNPQYITLCAIPELGLTFKVDYPSCYDSETRFKTQIQKSPFESGYSYEIYFADTLNGSNIINANGLYKLPDIGTVSQNQEGTPTESEAQSPVATKNTTNPSVLNKVLGNTVSSAIINSPEDIKKNGIVPANCGYDLKNGGAMCGFSHLIILIQRIIEYIFILVLPIAAIVFAYAGYLYMTSGGDTKKRSAAKAAMTNLVIGVFVVMSAWLIVKTLLVSLGVDQNASWFYLGK